MYKKIFLIFGMFFLFGILFSNINVSAAEYCCEQIGTTGPFCMEAEESECNPNLRKASPSCEATSFCKVGTCIKVSEGICTENTPENVCTSEGGTWKDQSADEISQCNLGCCLIGDQAAFVSQTRCKKLSSYFGLETTYRTDIQDELSCIMNSYSDEEGACVFESEFEKTCQRTTKKECQQREINPESSSILDMFDTTPSSISSVKFYPGKLCSSENLATNCGMSEKTNCVEGKDGVYFRDTCGNIANIYDNKFTKDQTYWEDIVTTTQSCGAGQSNAGSTTCGNCDYYAGSTCKADSQEKVEVGDNICKPLDCVYEEVKYSHGETWCAESGGVSKIQINSDEQVEDNGDLTKENLPGSRYFRMVCYNGEVTIEPCADYRSEVCVESKIEDSDFSVAQCRPNIWQPCILQDNKDDCEDDDLRDCQWINSGNPKSDLNEDEKEALYKDGLADGKDYLLDDEKYFQYVCAPKYAPGFNFWEASDAEDICAISTYQGVVRHEDSIIHTLKKYGKEGYGEDCVDNCFAIKDYWLNIIKHQFTSSLGDCGESENYLGVEGDIKWSDLFERKDE